MHHLGLGSCGDHLRSSAVTIPGSSVAGGSRLGSPAWREALGRFRGVSVAKERPCHPSPLASPLSRVMYPRHPDTTCCLWYNGTAFVVQDVTEKNSQLRGSCDNSTRGSELQVAGVILKRFSYVP